MGQQPASPFPSAGGSAASMSPAMHPLAPARQKKKLLAMIILVVAALVVVGALLFIGMKLLGGVKLEQYSNDSISVLVPAGYTKTEENGGASFKEKGGDKSNQSEVIAYYEPLPSGLSEGQIEQVRGNLRTVLQQAVENASGSGIVAKNVKIVDVTFNGDKALKLSADATRDGKKVGNYTMIAGINSKGVYVVGVGVHKSDPGLSKKVDTIINSFKIK
jgi:hypothetical protein